MKRHWFISACLLWSIASVQADSLVIGRTYEIVEPNALEEIKHVANAQDWQKLRKSVLQQGKVFKSVELPQAAHDAERSYIPYYQVPFAVTDGKGHVIYPKGYQFNPLEFVQLPNRLVIINQEHTHWLKARIQPGDKVILARGNRDKVQARIKQPVFILTEKIVARLGIRVVPTVIKQKGQQLIIQEYQVNERGKDDG